MGAMMTSRKPSSMSVPDWIEHQIRSAQAEGAFENLPGAGKPIPGLGRPQHELEWLANYLRRENADAVSVLPPALAIAKEVELLPQRLVAERSEAKVRAIIDELNTRIDKAHAAPQVGPPFRVKRVPVEATVVQWRADRDEIEAAAAARATAAPPEPAASRRRGFRLRRAR